MSTEAAAPKPSIEAEFLTAFAATPAVVDNGDKGTTETVAAQAPAPSEEGTPPAEQKTAEAVKTEPKPDIAPSLTRRLATLAATEKRQRDAEAARVAKDAEVAPALERLKNAKAAKTRAEAARIALELDDEAEADLFLELHQKYEGAGAAKPVSKDPAVELEKFVKAKLDEALTARDAERKAAEEKDLSAALEQYATAAIAILDARGDEFPLVAIAPPSQVDITAISEAWRLANNEVPEPEMVLKLIQDERQTKLDERRKTAETKKASTKTAPAKPAGETSGPKAKPIRDNDVTVSPPRKLSIAEEFTQAYRATSGG